MLQVMKSCEYYCTIFSCFQPWNMYSLKIVHFYRNVLE